MEENILEKFLLELNDKNIKYKTFVRFLNEYDGALLYIKSNYSMLLSNICSYDYIAVINFMFRDNNLKEIVQNNFLETMNNCPNKAYLCVILSIYLDGKNNEEKKEFLIPYFHTLVHSFKVPELRQLLEYKDLDSRFYNDLNEKITNNKQEYIKGNLLKKEIRGIDKEKDLDNLTSITTLMIDELLEEEHKNYVDISFSEGKYSLVFIIGDKVLSIGDRKEYDIPNHRRILQPLIRPNISSLTSSTDSLYTTMIDVSERVDTESEISEEELYLVYKELRDSNILWTDVKKENVGRLIKPNIGAVQK